ncbi:hypothetical protein HS7_11490 [Sulfolobales archaeon HS-7]|nr:hypothetical protein HS7_11490 [Sulfolobales archaeon HS-7]
MFDLYTVLIIFAISFASNATPFGGVSYTLVATTYLFQDGVNPVNVILAIVVTGLGAGVAKDVMYGTGLLLRKPLSNNKNFTFIKNSLINYRFTSQL